MSRKIITKYIYFVILIKIVDWLKQSIFYAVRKNKILGLTYNKKVLSYLDVINVLI